MENASKALLIAGAILVAILLIAMGVRVFNSTQGTTEATQTTMKSTEVAMFNNKFLGYVGENKSRAQVISLINLVISSNATNSLHEVKINNVKPTGVSGYEENNYTIGVQFDDKGYVNNIEINW